MDHILQQSAYQFYIKAFPAYKSYLMFCHLSGIEYKVCVGPWALYPLIRQSVPAACRALQVYAKHGFNEAAQGYW